MNRAYENDKARSLAIENGFIPVVPPRKNRKDPWVYDKELYKRRNEVNAMSLFVSIWRLDTNTLTVIHFNLDTLTEEHKTYPTDYIRYHLHYSDSKYPDRLRRLVNEGKII